MSGFRSKIVKIVSGAQRGLILIFGARMASVDGCVMAWSPVFGAEGGGGLPWAARKVVASDDGDLQPERPSAGLGDKGHCGLVLTVGFSQEIRVTATDQRD